MALLITKKGGGLIPEESLMHQLVSMIGEFPKAMASPLVGAGVLVGEDKAFYTTNKNVMRLLPTSGHEVVHAEEEALGKCAGLAPGVSVDIVVTLEPCRGRKPKGEIPCCQRIVNFSKNNPVRRVIIGILETGHGLRYLLSQNINVVLLHGKDHARILGPNALRAIDEFQRARNPNLRIIPNATIDPLNQEAYRRFLLAQGPQAALVLEMLRVVEAQKKATDLFAVMLQSFPTVLYQKNRPDFEKNVLLARNLSEPLSVHLEDFFRTQVWWAAARERSQKIEEELRQKEKTDDSAKQ
jgi:pyrimidine deaminase RibD-like protein